MVDTQNHRMMWTIPPKNLFYLLRVELLLLGGEAALGSEHVNHLCDKKEEEREYVTVLPFYSENCTGTLSGVETGCRDRYTTGVETHLLQGLHFFFSIIEA